MKKSIPDLLQRTLSLGLLAALSWFAAASAAAQEPAKDGKAAAETQTSTATPILSVIFDDPNQLFSTYAEGISFTDVRNSPEILDKEIATGIGGSAKIEISGGSEEGAEETTKPLVLLSDPSEGVKVALRLTVNKTVPGPSAFIRIKPESPETSLGAISSFKDGKVFLNGGFDMFFRYSEEPPPVDLVPFIFSSQGPGLHFVIHEHDQSIIAFLNDSEGKDIFDTDLDGTVDAQRVDTIKVNPVQLDPEQFHHLAVWFQTADDGTVTMKVFLKAGAGSINTAEDVDLVSTASFRIITDQAAKLLEQGSLAIGANSRANPDLIHNDVAAFRIFAPTPAVFPGLGEM